MSTICVAPPYMEHPGDTLELALYTPQRWPAERRTVTVRFVDGDQVQQAAVRVLVRQFWNRASGLQFVFVDEPPADVRVTFLQAGNWSHPGNYCLDVPEPLPTMCLSAVQSESRLADVRRVVLHEFGHACGYLHEQQSPNAAIPWDVPAVYAYFEERGWDKYMVDSQVLVTMPPMVAEAGSYDERSVMHYIFPAELMLDRVARGGGTMLSSGDLQMAKHWYGDPPAEPGPASPPDSWQWHLPVIRAGGK